MRRSILFAIALTCAAEAALSQPVNLTPHQHSTLGMRPSLYWTFADASGELITDLTGRSDAYGEGDLTPLVQGPHPASFWAMHFGDHGAAITAETPAALAVTTAFATLSQQTLVPVGQGLATDGEFLYAFNTTTVEKRQLAPPHDLVAHNYYVLDSVPGANHIGDGVHVNGSLYLPVERWSGSCRYERQHIVRLDASDLSVLDVWDVSDSQHEVAGIAFNQEHLVVASYCDGSRLWLYDKDTGDPAGVIVLEEVIAGINGLTYDPLRKLYYITSGIAYSPLNRIVAVDRAGRIVNDKIVDPVTPCAKMEGVDFVPPDTLYFSMVSGSGCSARLFKAAQSNVFTNGFVFEAMVFPETTTGTRVLLTYRDRLSANTFGLIIRDGAIRLQTGSPHTLIQTVAAPIAPNRWTHVAGRIDAGHGSVALFLDGSRWRRRRSPCRSPLRILSCLWVRSRRHTKRTRFSERSRTWPGFGLSSPTGRSHGATRTRKDACSRI